MRLSFICAQPVLRVLSATQLPKETIAELYDQISRTLSYREIAPSFLSLLSIGRGFPFYAAIVHTLKIYDPDSKFSVDVDVNMSAVLPKRANWRRH
jgi:hypothetical protein